MNGSDTSAGRAPKPACFDTLKDTALKRLFAPVAESPLADGKTVQVVVSLLDRAESEHMARGAYKILDRLAKDLKSMLAIPLGHERASAMLTRTLEAFRRLESLPGKSPREEAFSKFYGSVGGILKNHRPRRLRTVEPAKSLSYRVYLSEDDAPPPPREIILPFGAGASASEAADSEASAPDALPDAARPAHDAMPDASLTASGPEGAAGDALAENALIRLIPLPLRHPPFRITDFYNSVDTKFIHPAFCELADHFAETAAADPAINTQGGNAVALRAFCYWLNGHFSFLDYEECSGEDFDSHPSAAASADEEGGLSEIRAMLKRSALAFADALPEKLRPVAAYALIADSGLTDGKISRALGYTVQSTYSRHKKDLSDRIAAYAAEDGTSLMELYAMDGGDELLLFFLKNVAEACKTSPVRP